MIKINNFEYINLSQKNKIKKSIYKQIIINSKKTENIIFISIYIN